MWSDELTKVRRYLRDPDGNIWSDEFLRHLWNDIQADLQTRTTVLEDVTAQRVPDLYHTSYIHEFEWRHLDTDFTEFYQALRQHVDYVVCYNWEPQQIAGITPDTVDEGVHFTQPWEAFMGLAPGEEVRMAFPKNFHALKYIAYDEEPIFRTTRKEVQMSDSSYITHEGTPVAYYMDETLEKSYVLYPRPSRAFASDLLGDGVAFYVSDDSENEDYGDIALRSGSSETGQGVSVDVVGTVDNVLIVYDVAPTNLEAASDSSDFPDFLTKYIRFGVLSRAYNANTDGRIPSLAAFWGSRYELGVRQIKQFMRRRKADREYRLSTKSESVRRRRGLPRLPSTYPSI